MENLSCQRCICSDPFLRPPEVPIFTSTSPQAKSEMLKMQDDSPVYQRYLELCGNKTYVPVYSKTSSTTAQTTVVPGVTTLKDVTTEVTNITSLQNDTLVPPTSVLSSSSQDSDGWIAPVVIVIILLFIAVIVGGVYLYKKKGKKGFRKSVMYQNLSQCFFWNNLPTHQTRKASFSSMESKKSESSVGQIQPNSRIDQGVVYQMQVSNNEKDFKHSSTAQLIDAPLSHTDEEYSNPAIESTDVQLDLYENSSKVSFRQSYSSDRQTGNKASREDSKIESDTSQKEDSDTVTKADTIVSTYETCSPQTMSKPITEEKADTIVSDYETCSPETMSKPTTEEKLESNIHQEEEDSSHGNPSSGAFTESVYIMLTSETEESSSKKPQFNIDLDSHTTGDGKSSIQNQKSVDSGYESRINSPGQENVQHTYDLQTHESVNYLNNKAEEGKRWSGAHENINYLDNHAEKGQKWKGGDKKSLEESGKQGGYVENLNGTHLEDKMFKKSDNVNYNKNNKEVEVKLKNKDSVMKSDLPSSDERKSSPKHKPRVKKEEEAIYANSQFVKVAKADQLHKSAEKKTLVDTLSFGTRDISPPVDKKTHEMYYIDENPYDRVDSRKKPVPKKRNKVMQHDTGSK